MSLPVIIIGAGGHAGVLIDALLINSVDIIGITDPNPKKTGRSILDVPVLGNDDALERYSPGTVQLVNGIGTASSTARRKLIYRSFKIKGYTFASVVHPSALIARNVYLAEGVQIMAGTVIQTGSSIGENTIVNTRAAVDHDCKIDAHCHLAPGAILCGGVEIGGEVVVGSSATVLPNIKVGRSATIAAGAVVVRDLPPEKIAAGIPAKLKNA